MQPAVRTNLADTAIQNIRTEITTSRWQIGERIPNEATLADMLGISRGTVREAVRVLVSQGILETRQGSGTYVRSAIDEEDSLRPNPANRASRSGRDALCARSRGRTPCGNTPYTGGRRRTSANA